MMFRAEQLVSDALLVFKDRIVTVLCTSPLHADEVAVVELATVRSSYEGGICLSDLVQFASLINLSTHDIFVREQNAHMLELWLFAPERRHEFDEDPTPVDIH